MKLLTEMITFDKLEVIKETSKEGVKSFRLKGPFLEAEIKNKNGRVYSKEILVREVNDFCESKIKKNRSMGELDHPENPAINLERVSHIIESLEMKDNVGYGVAKLIDTPMGRIAKTLVDEGIIVGMSTRGVGTLDGETVKEDYKLITVDIVADPSAPNCFVEGVLENKEYIMNGDQIVEVAIQNLRKSVDKKYDSKSISNHTLTYMMNFINDIQQKKL
jgi:hypothetical protein